jgi:hypothetical protein
VDITDSSCKRKRNPYPDRSRKAPNKGKGEQRADDSESESEIGEFLTTSDFSNSGLHPFCKLSL